MKQQRESNPVNRDGSQSLHRAALLLRTVASTGRDGGRLVDLVRRSKLQRSTVYRMLQCLVSEGIVVQDPKSRRYYLGHLIFELGLAAVPRLDLRKLCEPTLQRIVERCGDTAYLLVRSGYDSVCLDRKEGSFPIKVLTVEVGKRRPLGVGAGGVALMMHMRDEDVEEIIAANASIFPVYGKVTPQKLRTALKRGRARGYAFNDQDLPQGAVALSVPVVVMHGPPAAISIGAITSRMDPQRREELLVFLRREVDTLERSLRSNASAVPFAGATDVKSTSVS
jgi:DNA-binding IclR family transcriptional regulator